MSPLDVIKDWTNCSDVNEFMDKVLNASDQVTLHFPSDDKLQQVAQTSFNERACNTYKVITQYLKEHSLDIKESEVLSPRLECLKKLDEKIKMINSLANTMTSNDTDKLAMNKAQIKAEKIINSLKEQILTQEKIISESEQLALALTSMGLPQADMKLIISQYSHIPFIRSLVNEIVTLNNQLKGNPSPKSNEKINTLLSNLSQFARLMERLLKFMDSEDKKLISQATLAQFTLDNVKSLPNLKPYLTGEKLLQGKNLFGIQNKMLTMGKEIEASLKSSPPELKQKRAASPISTTALEKQAKLQESLRKTAPWAAQQANLTPLGTSVNKVFKLANADGSKTVAFYKESPSKGQNAEVMEQLMWDSAVIMGFEDQFAATASIKLKTKKHFNVAGKSVKTWTAKGDLIDKEVKGARQGGFQPVQEGVSLVEYINNSDPNKVPIPHSQLVKGILASSIFGFFDAHRGNIIIDPEGNIRFFDNASSMPHSNDCILWGDDTLRSSFRCGLLNLPQTQEPLTPADRQMLRAEIEKCEVKFQKLKEFYENPITISSKISKLPQDWFHTDQVLQAMQERIQCLKAAALDPKITTLCDFALASQPHLKLHQAMTYIFYFADTLPFSPNKKYLSYMDFVGYNSIDTCIYKCSTKGIDPDVVKQWCDDPNLSFDQVIANISTYADRIDPSDAKIHADALIQELKSTARPDFKDW